VEPREKTNNEKIGSSEKPSSVVKTSKEKGTRCAYFSGAGGDLEVERKKTEGPAQGSFFPIEEFINWLEHGGKSRWDDKAEHHQKVIRKTSYLLDIRGGGGITGFVEKKVLDYFFV